MHFSDEILNYNDLFNIKVNVSKCLVLCCGSRLVVLHDSTKG